MPRSFDYDLARVLLVDADPASRLTLKTVLETSGYNVDSAASAAEAVGKLEDSEYELVLSDLHLESPASGVAGPGACQDDGLQARYRFPDHLRERAAESPAA